MKLEVIVDDAEVNGVIDAIQRTARTGKVGDGKIFLLPISDAIRIRTGDHGRTAL